MAVEINKLVTTTYRAIIAYTIANIPAAEKEETAELVGVSQLLEKDGGLHPDIKGN